ncbi:hypothetical protein PMAYCL1PPCAC_31758, partial [Pristionchus mayeri]
VIPTEKRNQATLMSCLTFLVLIAISISFSDSCMRVRPTDPGTPAVPCKSCAPIPIVDGIRKLDFSTDVVDDSGPCLKRTFACTAAKDARITVERGPLEGEAELPDDLDGMDGVANLVATCKADGSGWEATVVGVPLNVVTVYCSGTN